MNAPVADDRPSNSYRFAGSPDLTKLAAIAGGEAWTSFRRTLTPRFRMVWRDVGLCYTMLALGVVAQLGLVSQATAWQWWLAPVTGLWLGFWILALVSFFHEAAHFNIHADKRANDQLANWMIGGWIAQDVGHYRKVHWAHHLHLGSPDDTEVSYHNAPTLRFLLQTLCGIHLLRVFFRYRQIEPVEAKPRSRSALLRAAALHGSILTGLALMGFYSVCVAWCLGLGLFFPFFATLRQILEHRAADARLGVDYRHEPHGAHNRLFGTDLLSRFYGSAGFNRHLLHHWDPTISYTRFDDMDRFLQQTTLAPQLEDARTGYIQALRQVMHPNVAVHSHADETLTVERHRCPVCDCERTQFFALGWDSEYQTDNDRYAYRLCQDCDAVFLPHPPVLRLREIYPANYYSYSPAATESLLHRLKNFLDGRLFRKIIADIPGAAPLSVLDVGGGTGWLAKLVRSQNPRVERTHVVDLDDSLRTAAEAAGHTFSACRIEDFETQQPFDLILMLNLIEHVADPAAVLRQLRGAMSQGGRLLIKTPNTQTLSCRLFRNRNWGGFHCPRHWVLFHKENFAALAERCGLQVVWTQYTQGASQWTTSILGWLADRGWITINREHPVYTHRLFGPVMTLTALADTLLLPFLRPSQMFVLLTPAPDVKKPQALRAA